MQKRGRADADEQTLDILDNLDGCDAAVYDLERVIKGESAEIRLEQYMIIEKFNVTTEDGEVINTTLELVTNGGFEYGNGHSLILTQEGINENIYDARYDRRFDNEQSFRKYALEFVKEHVRDTCKVVKSENV